MNENQTQIETLARPAIRSTEWLAGAPEVQAGHRRNYLVTVEGYKGRRWVTTAYYANEYYLEWNEDYRPDDDDADGKNWTGWQSDRIDRWGDEVTMALEETVIGYMPLPAPANGGDDRFSVAQPSVNAD